ncbi:MAG: 3-phosphoshikimate 1-carboxyvinyltransferase [Clostridia bacterium]|nr:3-phosphoshikimate 1-carboxyvinyltransferase [Clostridia bacterium]
MTANIKPSKIRGTLRAPSSKSMGHRLLICAGLSEGESRIDNILYSEDILATLDCLSAMGAKIEKGEDYVTVCGTLPKRAGEGIYKCRESGSTLRFFIPIAMLSEKESLFTGYGRLMERPMTVYESIAKEKNLTYIKNSEGITVGGVLTSGIFTVPGNISSQFISGLLFALPLCEGDSEIELTGGIESKSYIDMTVYAMKLFGVDVYWKNENTLYIKGNQQYGSRAISVEGDYSNAAFLDAFNLLGGDVSVTGLDENSLQGDKIYKEYFSALRQGTPTLDIKNCPDLAPILMTLAAATNGCRLTNTARLKIKESDRGLVMARELSKFGADIELYENEITVNKAELYIPKDTLYCHNDHRVVMSLAVLSSVYGGTIEGTEAVKKSFPDFFSKVTALGLEVNFNDD